MTELENMIYKCALEFMSRAEERIKNIKTKSRYIEMPFRCDGCVDFLIYDTMIGKFTKILYTKAVGNSVSIEGIGEHSAFSDEVEQCEIEI